MNSKEREQLYTIRWHVREKWGEPSAKQDVLHLLGQLLDPAVTPEERPSVSQPGAKQLWCPFAQTDFPRSRTRGSYAKGYPLGAIVHFTAGRRSGLKAAMQEQVENGYTYFVIDEHGNIGQNFPLDSWGYHAGQSSWPTLTGTVSNDLVGIEIQSAGLVAAASRSSSKSSTTHQTWFGETIPNDQGRTIARQTANQQPGAYHRFTPAQETALLQLLKWLHQNNPAVFTYDHVLGHDEVSPTRKNDPGGSLSLTMPDLRKKLKG